MIYSFVITAPNRHILGYIVCALPCNMIRSFIFQVVGVRKTILVPGLFVGASCTGVPIFDVEDAQETHILVGPMFHNVQVMGVLNLSRLHSRWNVGDHLIRWWSAGANGERGREHLDGWGDGHNLCRSNCFHGHSLVAPMVDSDQAWEWLVG